MELADKIEVVTQKLLNRSFEAGIRCAFLERCGERDDGDGIGMMNRK